MKDEIRTGLVLEGGAMRGMFTAGVTDVMMENGITYDGMIGVSAGAAFGCNYKSGQPGRAIRYNTAYCNDPRYCSVRSLIRTGDMYGADFCYYEIPNSLDLFDTEAFRNSPMEFYVVGTDVETGKPVYKQCSDGGRTDIEWMRASASMPLVSRIVEIDGYKMLDGGISDSVPLRYFESIGYNRNVVVLTQPKNYIKSKNKMLPLMKITLRKYPNVIETMKKRHEIYNETSRYIRERELAGEIFVIRPEEALPIGHVEHDPEKLRAVYRIGRETMEQKMDSLRDFLKK